MFPECLTLPCGACRSDSIAGASLSGEYGLVGVSAREFVASRGVKRARVVISNTGIRLVVASRSSYELVRLRNRLVIRWVSVMFVCLFGF